MSQHHDRGAISIVGIGPGAVSQMTVAARLAIENADVILGYETYLRLIAGLATSIPREVSGMRQEIARGNRAIDLAASGKRVAVVSSGDPGSYGMAGLVYEILHQRGESAVRVEVFPGVPALNAAAALLGAPLMADFCAISLSDQLVPLSGILRRLELATQADFVICLYNPKGRKRRQPFVRACEILACHRAPNTPVGIVRAAYRDGQAINMVTLSELPQAEVDMVTIIIVGNSLTYVTHGKMVTRRGYTSRYDLEAT